MSKPKENESASEKEQSDFIDGKLLHQMSRIILQNEKRLIREQDLRNLCTPEEFKTVIPQLVVAFKTLGFSLIRTTYQDEKYYVLTASGKDADITPSMYGTLALILGTLNEIGESISLDEMKRIFSDVWIEVEALIQANYLTISKMDRGEMLEVTPLGKGSLKNVIRDLDLKKLLSFQKGPQGERA